MRRLKIIIPIIIAYITPIAIALAIENLGVYGHVYNILEPDMFQEIKKSDVAISREQMIKKLREKLNINLGLPRARERKREIVELSYQVPQDVIINRNIIARKGDVINPLDRMRFNEKYVFMAEDQLNALKPLFRDKTMKAVITDGNIERLIDKYPDIKFYMASRSLIEMFRIKEIPSIVFQPDGCNYIIVQTIPIKGGN